MARRSWSIVAAVAFVIASANAAAQQQVTTTYGPFSITSTSGTQISNVLFTQLVNTTGVLRVRYNASAGHCSNVSARIIVDGINRGQTAFLTPGQSSGFIDVGPVSAGQHTVALQGEGQISGCNAGLLQGWGGTMDVVSSVAPAAPVPSPGLLATLLAFVAGALWLGPWRRRR